MAYDNVRTREGQRVLVSQTAYGSALTQAQYEAITDWFEVENVGQVPATGTETNYPTYNLIKDGLARKARGVRTPGSGSVEYARASDAPGQKLLRGLDRDYTYPVAIVMNDAPVGKTNTVIYNRAHIGLPSRPDAQLEDFDIETVAFEMTDYEVYADPEALVTLANSAVPTISGTASVGEVLTATGGTWTGSGPISLAYQWYSEGVAISGETASTYTVGAGESGNDITVAVTATGNVGTEVTATSAATTIS
ncbi:phage tail tube protein [Martelella limonii]|uniref:phage tail tube protein n=1 Tax=Martelella limonii TaxID=1647649 RepID=UPI00158097A3|nr:phage tail tube protein [Martelella limonii]